ncbi:MAG: ATP-binding protein, partial [Burkholderiaceae bacterium]
PVLLAQLDGNYRPRFVDDRHAAPFALSAANGGRRLTDFVSGETLERLCRYAKAARAAPPEPGAGREHDLIAAISDIARLRRAEDQLYRREREFKTLVENSPDVIARIGRDMRHLYVSPAAEAAFGFAPAACLGKTKAELGFPAPTVKIWDAMVGRAFESGAEQQFGFSQMLGEQARFFSVRVIPEFDRDGRVESVLAITYDVTERTRLEQEREQLLRREREARIQAETAARARDEFLAIVSHELRGPLNGIQSWAHVLENQVHAAGAPALAQRALHGIRTGVDQQVRLIEDLLDVTRMMSGRLRLVKRPFSILPAIQAAVESVREAAAAKNIAIATRYHIASEKIDGDPDRVQQVVWNLMSNAVKFTPEGGRIEVDAGSKAGEVSVTVADNGAGIAPDFLPHLFDRFSQKDTSSTRGHSGLGLGLFLVQHLVELHGGRIEAASAGEGMGARFTLRLPLRDKPESYAFSMADGDGNSARRLPSLAGRNVLLLDDQEEAREAVTAVLTAAGARVFAAGSTAEIFRWLPQIGSTEMPDVLVCDIAMPGEDGYAALHRIRTWKARRGKAPLQRLPALALTAFSQPEDRIQALTAGFQMHLTKPVAPDELLVVLASLAPRQ